MKSTRVDLRLPSWVESILFTSTTDFVDLSRFCFKSTWKRLNALLSLLSSILSVRQKRNNQWMKCVNCRQASIFGSVTDPISLLIFYSCWADALQKSHYRFKPDCEEIWQDCSSSKYASSFWFDVILSRYRPWRPPWVKGQRLGRSVIAAV